MVVAKEALASQNSDQLPASKPRTGFSTKRTWCLPKRLADASHGSLSDDPFPTPTPPPEAAKNPTCVVTGGLFVWATLRGIQGPNMGPSWGVFGIESQSSRRHPPPRNTRSLDETQTLRPQAPRGRFPWLSFRHQPST